MAQELTSQRRYDEALEHYFQALELDPKNVDLRLHKGFVEEKLGLYLDAGATYRAASKLANAHTGLYGRGARCNVPNPKPR
jgi:tetratricopeptide (TPR) repeat protein